MKPQTLETIKSIVSNVSFNDWTFRVDTNADDSPYLQVLFIDKDRITGAEEIQRCRKWQLSYYMVNSEVVRTAFKAVEAAMLHEVQEAFKYKGARVYNPHVDLDSLAAALNDKTVAISLRDESNYNPTVKL
jgi:hypothetical protein